MPRDAWESLHGGSRKWFPEQRPRSPESGTEQSLLAPLPITGTSAPTSLKHQVRTAARPSMPKPGQDSRQRHRPNSDRHEEWTPRSVDKRVLAHNAEYSRSSRPVASAPLERRSSCYDSSPTGCGPSIYWVWHGNGTGVARSRDLLRRPDIGCCACSPRTREPSEPRMIAIRRCLRCAAAGVHRGAGDRRQVGGRDWPCCGTGMRGNSLGLAGSLSARVAATDVHKQYN